MRYKILKKVYGVYDTVDKVWLGSGEATSTGPKLFDDRAHAKVAARLVDVQLGVTPGRHREKKFPKGQLRLREIVPTKMTPLETLTGLEEGRYL